MKIDPYKHKEKYNNWKERNPLEIPGISKENSEIALQYLNDMERGINVASASVKGARSYIRLNSLREKMMFFSTRFNELYGLKRMTDITEEQLLGFFSDMKNGKVKRKDGSTYKSTETAGKAFKAFWHWWMKINKKKGIELQDITIDLDTRAEKPDWVYLTEKELKTLCEHAKPEYRVLIMFLFDTGMRAPTELMNIKVSDLYNDYKEVNVREETSKTFGRRIKLMLCSEILQEYIKNNNLSEYLFPISPHRVNEYLKRLAKRLFGDAVTPAGAKYSELTMYDFRHISCCYWLPRYKSESALKYRFGWKKSDKIHYYSELLGMKDTISEDDMLVDLTKTEIEKRLEKSDKEKDILSDRLRSVEKELEELKKVALEIIRVSQITR